MLDETITVYFLMNEEVDESSEDISSAYSYIKDHLSDDCIKWLEPSAILELIKNQTLTKQDVFVLDKFHGILFEKLQKTKSLIVGPRCIIQCLLECSKIPLGNSPVFTTAMRDLHVCLSGFDAEEKEKLRNLVTWMGGYFYLNLGQSITHLVSNTIKSTKYEQAALNGITIMSKDWIYKAWEHSCKETMSANDSEFVENYKLPVFYNANITCTGLETEKRNSIMKLVNENGGIYNRAFRSQITEIVIIEKNKTNSDKYQAAVRYKKEILIPEWIFDSVKKGFALPTKNYTVGKMKASTPNKNTDETINDNNCTQISEISRNFSVMSRADLTVNDSMCSVASMATRKRNMLTNTKSNILDKLCPNDAKKAGTFLDDCTIYLCGFNDEEKDKVMKILNIGGARQFDEINEKITHVIVGRSYEKELNKFRKLGLLTGVYVVKLEWILDSIKIKQTANEQSYAVDFLNIEEPNVPSPSSKQTLRSMNHSFKQPEVPKKRLDFNADIDEKPLSPDSLLTLVNEPEDLDLLSQYSQENQQLVELPLPIENLIQNANKSSEPKHNSSNNTLKQDNNPQVENSEYTECVTENLDFLTGLSVYVVKKTFRDDQHLDVEGECDAARGILVKENFQDIVDYAIVSFENYFDPSILSIKYKHVVTDLWLEDCLKENQALPVQYYHQPIPCSAENKPLTGMVIVLSIYTGCERDFIETAGHLLGAVVNKVFVKKEKPLLICPLPEGSKYEGAIKWNFPIVTSAWLIECANKGYKVEFEPYLVGNSPLSFPSPQTSDVENRQEKYLCKSNKKSENDFTPLRNKRVSELAGPNKTPLISDRTNSPRTPVSNTNCYDIFDNIDEFLADITNEKERKCMKECIMELKKNQTPEIERMKRLACTPGNRRIATPKGIPEFCTTPEFQKRMWEVIDKRWKLPVNKRKLDTPIEEIRKKVLKCTFDKYGIDLTPNKNTPKIKKPNLAPSISNGLSNKQKFSDRIEIMDDDCSKVSISSSPAVKQLSDFIKNCEGRRQSMQKQKTAHVEETEGHLMKFESEMVGGSEEMVGWRDPTEFTLSRRTKINVMQYNGTPKFTISSTNEAVKMATIEKIRRLRGDICENLINFDPTCTHLLCERPNRGEKMLGCISSGKWVLHIDYIEECSRQGHFIDEELFELGNPKCNTDLPDDEQIIVRAAYRWRKRISEAGENAGAFVGFRVILNLSEKLKASITAVITAGRGIVIDILPPYSHSEETLTATHCFVDVKKAPLSRSDHKFFIDNDIRVLSQKYINSYLMNTLDPEGDSFQINL